MISLSRNLDFSEIASNWGVASTRKSVFRGFRENGPAESPQTFRWAWKWRGGGQKKNVRDTPSMEISTQKVTGGAKIMIFGGFPKML